MGDVKNPITCGHAAIGASGSHIITLEADTGYALILCPVCSALVRDMFLMEIVRKVLDDIATRGLNNAKSE